MLGGRFGFGRLFLFRSRLFLGDLFQQHDILDMVGPGEHIHRLHLPHPVGLLRGQHRQVPRLGSRIAGDIDDPRRGAAQRRLQKGRVGSGPRRVHKQHVDRLTHLRQLGHIFTRIGADKSGVLDPVAGGVFLGVGDGVRVDLDAQHLSGIFRGRKADRADAAVGVQHPFLSGQAGVLDRRFVEYLGLHRIDLVEGSGRDPEGQAAEGILDVPLAVEDLLSLAQQQIGLAVVDGKDDRRDLGVRPKQRRRKVFLGRKDRRSGDQHHHHLSGGKASADQQMAEEAALLRRPGGHLKGGQQLAHRDRDRRSGSVLDHAGVDGGDLLLLRLPDARYDPVVAGLPEGHLHLVAVVGRVVHADDRMNLPVAAQQLFDLRLLPAQTVGIGQVLHLAAGALFRDRTAGGVDRTPVLGRGGLFPGNVLLAEMGLFGRADLLLGGDHILVAVLVLIVVIKPGVVRQLLLFPVLLLGQLRLGDKTGIKLLIGRLCFFHTKAFLSLRARRARNFILTYLSVYHTFCLLSGFLREKTGRIRSDTSCFVYST